MDQLIERTADNDASFPWLWRTLIGCGALGAPDLGVGRFDCLYAADDAASCVSAHQSLVVIGKFSKHPGIGRAAGRGNYVGLVGVAKAGT